MKQKNNIRRTLYYFWQTMMQFKARSIALLLLVPVWVFISNVVVPYGTSQIVGKLSSGDFELSNYVGLLLITILPAAVNNLGVLRAIDWLDWSIDALGGEYLAKLAFDAVINQSMTFHSNRFSGSLTSAANKLPNAFIDLKSNFMWQGYPLFLTLAFSLVTAAVVCWPFALMLFAYAAIYLTVSAVTYYKTLGVDEKLSETGNKMTGQLADAITNEMSVKSYAREKEEARRFGKATASVRLATFGVARVSLWRNLAMNAVNLVTFAGLLVMIVLSHDLFGLTISSMVFLYSLSNTLLNSVWSFNGILRSVNRSLGNAKEMVEILDMPVGVKDNSKEPLLVLKGGILFEGISFQHEGKQKKLFSDFDLNVEAGETVGLVGVSGSGKTTLTKLLLRFADVTGGAIRIDGQDIREVTQRSLRGGDCVCATGSVAISSVGV